MSAGRTMEQLVAGWRRMDADSAALVLRNTTWSYLTGGQPPATAPVEPVSDWEGAPPEELSSEERAARVAWTVLTHDPRFARQLRRLLQPPFSEDLQEFIYLLLTDAARVGGAYVHHFDREPSMPIELASRMTAAVMDIEQLPDRDTERPEAATGSG